MFRAHSILPQVPDLPIDQRIRHHNKVRHRIPVITSEHGARLVAMIEYIAALVPQERPVHLNVPAARFVPGSYDPTTMGSNPFSRAKDVGGRALDGFPASAY